MIYSPHPMSAYQIKSLSNCEVRVIQQNERAEAVWNLFWMSVPSLDHLPTAGFGWWKLYQPMKGALAAIIVDVMNDEVLYRKLMMPPAAFIQWFERDDHSVYESQEVFGKDWHETVLARADDAMHRCAKQVPQVYADKNGIRIVYNPSEKHDSV